jgi:hypothetical protein
MCLVSKILIALGCVFLVVAAVNRFIVGQPYILLGVRALSLIALANTAFLLAVLVKLSEKK